MEKIARVIDAHCLVGTDYWLSRHLPTLHHENLLDDYDAQMSSVAIVHDSVIMPFPSSEDGSYLRENSKVLKLHESHPSTYPVLAFNYRLEESYEFVRDALKHKRARGIVLWPILCNLDLQSAIENDRFSSLLSNYDCWVSVHVGAGNEKRIGRVDELNRYCPDDALQLAKAFPNTRFNLTHLLRLSDSALRQAEDLDNIVMDTSGISTHLRWYEQGENVFPADDAGDLASCNSATIINRLMQRPGLQDKIVFGTQFPFGKWYGFNAVDEVRLIRAAGLPTCLESKLLYGNFERFLEEM